MPRLSFTVRPADEDRGEPAVGQVTSGFPHHGSAQFVAGHPAIAEMKARIWRQHVRGIGHDEVKCFSCERLEQITLAGHRYSETIEGSVEAGICQRPWVNVRGHYLVAVVQCEQRLNAGAGAEIEHAPSL